MTLGLAVLNDDVLLKIAYECTPNDVLALERTCKSLRILLSVPNRPLWLHLLQLLDDSHAPDLPPYVPIKTLASAELKQLVSHAVRGFTNWNRSTSSKSISGPRVTRRRIIDLKNTSGLLGDLHQSTGRHRDIVKILPGGKFVCVLWSEGYLQCWDAETNKTMWTYPQLGAFAEVKVLAFDVEFDVDSGQLFFVVAGRYLEPTDSSEPCFIELFWLNPELRRATKIRGRSIGWEIPSLIRICGDALIISGSHCIITNKRLERCFALRDVDILRDTMSVTDSYFTFIGKEPRSFKYTLFALDAQRVFSGYRAPKIPSASRGPLSFTLSIKSDLNNFVLEASIPTGPDQVVSAHLVSCTPTWRDQSRTTICVIAKLSGTMGCMRNATNTRTRFSLCTYHLSSRLSTSSPLLPPPYLTLVRSYAPISIPLSHSYCTDDVHSLSHSGRGVLSSANTLHGSVRYYAFSIEALSLADNEGAQRESPSLGPLLFGRERVAPSEVYVEKYSGALAFISKDQRSLVIQYFD